MTKKRKKKPHTPMQLDKDFTNLLDHLQTLSFANIGEVNAYLDTLSGQNWDEALPARKGPAREQDKAQELVYKAFEEGSVDKALALAEQALKLDPHNVDALCIRAELSEDIGQAIQYYQQGVEAAREALGDEFEEYRGHFWGFHETRPFMRAKAGLADALYFVGRTGEAIQSYWEMLELNPNDNQGIRFKLATWLLEQGDFEGFEKLYKLFPDEGSASWLYSHALYLFKTQGDTYWSDKALKKALRRNKHVPAFLLGKKALPKVLPDFMGMGDETEAVEYVINNLLLWQKTPMAIVWLKKNSPR
jgi:tetratricopeptide (TPR) repeat protein